MFRKAIILGVLATAGSLAIFTRMRVQALMVGGACVERVVGYRLGFPAHYLELRTRGVNTDTSISITALIVDLAFWSILCGCGIYVVRERRNKKLNREGRCLNCGYDLRGLPENRCPECGRADDSQIDPASSTHNTGQ